jgi:hypothetical protein
MGVILDTTVQSATRRTYRGLTRRTSWHLLTYTYDAILHGPSNVCNTDKTGKAMQEKKSLCSEVRFAKREPR